MKLRVAAAERNKVKRTITHFGGEPHWRMATTDCEVVFRKANLTTRPTAAPARVARSLGGVAPTG
jgi:hypothetical protein